VRIKIRGEYWSLSFDKRKNLQGCYGVCMLPKQPCETKGCTEESPCALCSTYNERDIVIADNLVDKDELGTIIHEMIHACLPEYKEHFVDDIANSLTDALWKLGYRKN